MPSIKMKPSSLVDGLSKSALMVLCTTLVACGSGDGTTRVTEKEDSVIEQEDPHHFNLAVRIPMEIKNAKLTIGVIGEDTLLYDNADFAGFNATVNKLSLEKYKNKIIWVKLIGTEKSQMYDTINNHFVSFNGELNAIAELTGSTFSLSLTPASEAIFQRTLVRAGNLNVSTPTLSLVTAKHINKATTEINASLNGAFNVAKFPEFNTSQSIARVYYLKNTEKDYINIFTGMGLLRLWAAQNPNEKNTYLSLAQNLAVDMRDGYLDGRTLQGDHTVFTAFQELKNTPKNVNPEQNTLLDIGKTQEAVRLAFGESLRTATLNYATQTFQSERNPDGLIALEKNIFYPQNHTSDSNNRFRWNGAGDYRPAFGIKPNEKQTNIDNACQPEPPYPCKQGLNADDIGTYYSDVEYLIGTHTVGQCKIEIFPSGDVRLTKGSQMVNSSINRDMSDNVQQINRDNKHYVLNIGAGENKPPHFMQLEIKDAQIIQVKTGYTTDNFYTDLQQLQQSDTSLTCS